jgi:DNA mismatch repair ATPase MutL
MTLLVKVVAQVDCKFILCLLRAKDLVADADVGGETVVILKSSRQKPIVMMIDQHAAHERVRLERLQSVC